MNIELAIEKRDQLKPLVDEFNKLNNIITAYDLVITHLKKAKAKGSTKRDLKHKIRNFDSLSVSQSQDLLDNMIDKSIVEIRELETPSGRGRKRVAYFYIGGDK